MNASANEIADAYLYCRRVTRQHAKSFFFATQFLRREKRLPIYALYALCRYVDDTVDDAGVNAETEAQFAIEVWRGKLAAAYRGAPPANEPILQAWSDVLQTYPLAEKLPLELMRGVLMDTYQKRYATWEELKIYCYRVASVVGLMSSEIFGYTGGAETLEYAKALGYAMQLTNILRDVGEDACMGRIYLPQDEMQTFGYSENELLKGVINENFIALMSFQIKRARALYAEAELGIPRLSSDARAAVFIAARLYAKILDAIERNNYDVFTHRAHLTLSAKLVRAPALWRAARRLREPNL